MKLLSRMNKSNNRKNSGFTLVELVIVMAIMGILGLAVVGFIGTSTKQYKYASKDVDLQYEAQLTMNQIGDLIIDAQKGVKYEPATVAAPVEVASANPETGYIATASASAEEGQAEEASSEETSSDSKLIIYNKDCTYYIIYRPSEHKIYLRKDTLDPATGVVKADGQGKESLMAENVTGFTPDLSEAESKNSVGIVVDFKAGDKKYTSKQNFTMRNKVPTGADVEYVAPAEPEGIRIYYKGKDVTNGTVYYEMKKTNNNLKFTDKILGGKYDSKNVTWNHSGTLNGGKFYTDNDNNGRDVYNVELMSNETTDQFVITVTSIDDPSLTAKVTVNVAHPINILHCTDHEYFSRGSTHNLNIDEGELTNSSLNGKYQIKDFVWHIEVESVSSTGATEHKGDIAFKMGDDGKLINYPADGGDTNGIFKYSPTEWIVGTGGKNNDNSNNNSNKNDPEYYKYLLYSFNGGNQNMYVRIALGEQFLAGEKLNVSVWLGLEGESGFKSNTITFYTYHETE